jgi:hypothetical protein
MYFDVGFSWWYAARRYHGTPLGFSIGMLPAGMMGFLMVFRGGMLPGGNL